MTRYAKRIDTNHADIVSALRAIPGMKLLDTSGMAGLGADLICSWQGGPPTLIEIKSHPKKPLTDSERRARSLFTGYWHRVDSFDDALRVFGIGTEGAPF